MKIASIRRRLLWKLLLRLQYSITSIGTNLAVWKRISVLLYKKGEVIRMGKGLQGLISWLTLWFSIPLGHVL